MRTYGPIQQTGSVIITLVIMIFTGLALSPTVYAAGEEGLSAESHAQQDRAPQSSSAYTVAPAMGLSETTSLAAAIFKVMGALTLVLLLMMAVLYFIKKTGITPGSGGGSSLIRVVETRMVAPKKYIAVVEVAGKGVAVGITENSINMLTEIDQSALHKSAAAKDQEIHSSPLAKTFAKVLAKSLKTAKTEPSSLTSDAEEKQ